MFRELRSTTQSAVHLEVCWCPAVSACWSPLFSGGRVVAVFLFSYWRRCLDWVGWFVVGSSCISLGANRWKLFDNHFCFVIYTFGPHKIRFSVTKSLLALHLGCSYNDSGFSFSSSRLLVQIPLWVVSPPPFPSDLFLAPHSPCLSPPPPFLVLALSSLLSLSLPLSFSLSLAVSWSYLVYEWSQGHHEGVELQFLQSLSELSVL